MMRGLVAAAFLAFSTAMAAAQSLTPPAGGLKAAYLSTNPAQAIRNVVTGEIKGAAAELAREIARRRGVAVSFAAFSSPAAVIEAVRTGAAEVGFLAPDDSAAVAFTRPYMLVQQSFLVREDSAIKSVADVDKAGRVIAASSRDTIGPYLKGWVKQAALRESADTTLQEAVAWLGDGAIDAFGGSRQRLASAQRGAKGLRLLPDNLYGAPQAIAVAKDKPELLTSLNALIVELRGNGFLKTAVEGGVEGVVVAPEM
ncbi:MAG: hypothetical protein BGP06_13125 [Rhizobiales bacterium 65-9]|nr:transporter substrate-binding domain-containing protein [Hyphomicrobiales bacterium]OJY34066.1 MAG: hypothetical protein BGP06_13125 [Rhizobiales bacterium 65-9]